MSGNLCGASPCVFISGVSHHLTLTHRTGIVLMVSLPRVIGAWRRHVDANGLRFDSFETWVKQFMEQLMVASENTQCPVGGSVCRVGCMR